MHTIHSTINHFSIRRLIRNGIKCMDYNLLVFGVNLCGLGTPITILPTSWRTRSRPTVCSNHFPDYEEDGLTLETEMTTSLSSLQMATSHNPWSKPTCTELVLASLPPMISPMHHLLHIVSVMLHLDFSLLRMKPCSVEQLRLLLLHPVTSSRSWPIDSRLASDLCRLLDA